MITELEFQGAEPEKATGPISIDSRARRAFVNGTDVRLTALEHRLLVTLMERRGRAQSRQQLYRDVWRANPEVQTRTVDMHIQRLRRKLGDLADLIETVRGVGYRFNDQKKRELSPAS